MENKKAIVCTVLYTVVIIGAMIGSIFIRNEELGISLYEIAIHAIAIICIINSVKRFYNWLVY